MSFLNLLYFWLNPRTRESYWEGYGGNCLFYGFLVLLIISCATSVWFYFFYTRFDATKALVKKWFKIGIIGAIVFFIIVEIILAKTSGLLGKESYFGKNGDIIGFSIINTLFHFPIMYILWSWIFKQFSRNAIFIPWVGLKYKKKDE